MKNSLIQIVKVLAIFVIITQLLFAIICNFFFQINVSSAAHIWKLSKLSEGLHYMLSYQFLQLIVTLAIVVISRLNLVFIKKRGILGLSIGFFLPIFLTGLFLLASYHLFDLSIIHRNSLDWELLLFYVAILGLGSLSEELIFRGYIFNKIIENEGHVLTAVVISSTLFGLVHILAGVTNPITILSIVFLGVILCVLNMHFGLTASIFFHFSLNFINAFVTINSPPEGYRLTALYTFGPKNTNSSFFEYYEYLLLITLSIAAYAIHKIFKCHSRPGNAST
jgi:membrane protease YdiL (CAAX protease family)